ncbi:MAG: SCO family protein [Acidobacteriota bacterium]|nr:SCO family protein [Acidobacteriota bacterium]
MNFQRVVPIAIGLLLVSACARHRDLPNYGHVPAFELTSQTGAPFDRKSLDGSIWVADFIFTNCEGPCPRMSSRMYELQKATGGDMPGLKLVSFTVDPARDTPPVLAEYAKRFQAEPNRWTFLTGDPLTLQLLDREAFKLGNLSGAMDHSTRFVLVDRKGNIRSYYRIGDGDPVGAIISDARQLAKENL